MSRILSFIERFSRLLWSIEELTCVTPEHLGSTLVNGVISKIGEVGGLLMLFPPQQDRDEITDIVGGEDAVGDECMKLTTGAERP